MKKQVNKEKSSKNDKSKLNFTIIFVIALVFISLLSIYKGDFSLNSFYKVESRVDKLDEMKKKDRDRVVGWIRVQGTNIDYPVLYNQQNLDSISYSYGWINSNSKELSNNVVVFGHNIRNVSSQPLITNKDHERFEQLPSLIYYDFAKKNQYIQYTINGKDYLYQIFSVSIVKDKFIDYEGKELSKKRFEEIVAGAKYDSYFDYGVRVKKDDKIITLVTCTRFYGGLGYDFRVVAKLVGEKKIGAMAKVKENKNYEEIKKKLMNINNKSEL